MDCAPGGAFHSARDYKIQRGMQNGDKSVERECVINGLVDLSLLFWRALCPFVPPFREMAGVPLALMDDATGLIFALRCPVLLCICQPSAVHARATKTPN